MKIIIGVKVNSTKWAENMSFKVLSIFIFLRFWDIHVELSCEQRNMFD